MDDAEVHVGRDRFLFLSGGRHGVFSYFSGDKDPRPGSPDVFRRNLEERKSYCDQIGARFRMVVFPEKCVALASKIDLKVQCQSLYERCYSDTMSGSSADDQTVYPIQMIHESTDAFFQTDTHYAAPGNLAVTRAVIEDLFPDESAAGFAKIEACMGTKPGYSGDLGRKLDPPQSEDGIVLKAQAVPFKMASNGVKGGNDGICVLTSSPEAMSNKTLLIFGDSFFRQLLPMLAVFYRRIIFCRTRFFHYEMVDGFQPDDIFCGLAERYLSGCASDKTRPHFLSYPLVLGRTTAPDPDFPAFWDDFMVREALIK